MSDAEQQPTEEELRAYLQQLRDADATEILAQAYTVLGTGAEVKLGRSDARVLIDALSALVESAAARVPDDLARRMREGVGQLQMAQVEAERQAVPEQRQQPGQPQQQAPAEAAGEAPGQQQKMTDRLWIPGRDG